jgi:hypothetical protein
MDLRAIINVGILALGEARRRRSNRHTALFILRRAVVFWHRQKRKRARVRADVVHGKTDALSQRRPGQMLCVVFVNAKPQLRRYYI